jgi:hypothetical protein
MAPTLSKKNLKPVCPRPGRQGDAHLRLSGRRRPRGETFRGNDPAVVAGWSSFVDGETLDEELESPFDGLPPLPEFAEPVEVRDISIPVHRQVRCIVDVSVPVRWAPGSPGAESRTPAPFIRSTLRAGQICDVLTDVVRKNPNWFRWEARDVMPDDVERLEKLETLEREGDEAVRR